MSENNLIENQPEKKNNQSADILGKISQAVRGSWFKWFVGADLIIFVLAGTFSLGMMVGYKKADFSYRWAENYHKNFGEPQKGIFVGRAMPPFPMGPGDDFISGFGVAGTLLKTEGKALILKGGENVEKTVIINEETAIREGSRDLRLGDLKIGDRMVIIGRPNEAGQTEAGLIRVFNLK